MSHHQLIIPQQIHFKINQNNLIEIYLKEDYKISDKIKIKKIVIVKYVNLNRGIKMRFMPSKLLKKNKILKHYHNETQIRIQIQNQQIYKNLHLGYFIFYQIHRISEQPFYQDCNLIMHNNSFLHVQNRIIVQSQFKIKQHLLFYKYQNQKIKFYHGYNSYQNNNQIYLKFDNQLCTTNQQNYTYKFQEENDKIKIKNQLNNKYITKFQQKFIQSNDQSLFSVTTYQPNQNYLTFKNFGFNDNIVNVFCLNQTQQVTYQQIQNKQIEIRCLGNLLKFYINNQEIFLKIQIGKLKITSQQATFFFKKTSQYEFFIYNQNNHYLNFDGQWKMATNIFLFKQKPYGFYIFQSSQPIRCLSTLGRSSIFQNRLINPSLAVYFSTHTQKFYVNYIQIFVQNNFTISFNSGNRIQIIVISETELILKINKEGTNFYLKQSQNYNFEFTLDINLATIFTPKNKDQLAIHIPNFYQIKFQTFNLKFGRLVNQYLPQNTKTKYVYHANGYFSSLQFQIKSTLTSFLGIQLNLPNFASSNTIQNLCMQNITQIFPNFYSCYIKIVTFNFFNQIIQGYYVGKDIQSGQLKKGSKILFYFHKIPSYHIFTNNLLQIRGLCVQNNFLSLDLNEWSFFQKITQNIWILKLKEFYAVYDNQYFLRFLGSVNNFYCTFSIITSDQIFIEIYVKSWKGINGGGTLLNPIGNSNRIRIKKNQKTKFKYSY